MSHGLKKGKKECPTCFGLIQKGQNKEKINVIYVLILMTGCCLLQGWIKTNNIKPYHKFK